MYRRALLRFPQHATILVNYATLCMYTGYHALARKYIAKAYAASSGDLNCTMCYAHYLCRSYDDQQIGCGESLYSGYLDKHPNASQAHAAFANFLAGAMPTPFKTEIHFKRALELGPKSEDVVLQYGQFMWACTDTKNVYTNDEVRRRVFDRAEQLFKEAVAINPNSFTACHQLGTFYANRHHRFEEAMTMLYRAHKLQPGNVEVLRHLLSTLHEECVRVQREEQRHNGTVAGQGGSSSISVAAVGQTSRLRSLTSATQDMFENVLAKEPGDRATLERYARFAVETLKDPRLAASLYSRIQELNRK
jgi:Tfp pilus assembly protein PilF